MEEIVHPRDVHWGIQTRGFLAFKCPRSLLQLGPEQFFFETNLPLQTFTVFYHSKHCYCFPPRETCLILNWNSCRMQGCAWVQYTHPGVISLHVSSSDQLHIRGFRWCASEYRNTFSWYKVPWHFRESWSAGVSRIPGYTEVAAPCIPPAQLTQARLTWNSQKHKHR